MILTLTLKFENRQNDNLLCGSPFSLDSIFCNTVIFSPQYFHHLAPCLPHTGCPIHTSWVRQTALSTICHFTHSTLIGDPLEFLSQPVTLPRLCSALIEWERESQNIILFKQLHSQVPLPLSPALKGVIPGPYPSLLREPCFCFNPSHSAAIPPSPRALAARSRLLRCLLLVITKDSFLQQVAVRWHFTSLQREYPEIILKRMLQWDNVEKHYGDSLYFFLIGHISVHRWSAQAMWHPLAQERDDSREWGVIDGTGGIFGKRNEHIRACFQPGSGIKVLHGGAGETGNTWVSRSW